MEEINSINIKFFVNFVTTKFNHSKVCKVVFKVTLANEAVDLTSFENMVKIGTKFIA